MNRNNHSFRSDGLRGLSDCCIEILGLIKRIFGISWGAADSFLLQLNNNRFWDVALGGTATLLLLGFLWAQLDPFGLGRASDMYSEQIIDRIIRPLKKSIFPVFTPKTCSPQQLA
jgi:hypothetical protein